jgi:hypothetical protein
MIEDIKALIESHGNLALQAHEHYRPLVNSIISSGNKDVNHICHTLDGILSFCYDDRMLLLYRRLCRYLLDIDQQAAVDYVNYYREMWDEEGVKFGNKKEKINEK